MEGGSEVGSEGGSEGTREGARAVSAREQVLVRVHRGDDRAARRELVLDRRHIVLDEVDPRPRLPAGQQPVTTARFVAHFVTVDRCVAMP